MVTGKKEEAKKVIKKPAASSAKKKETVKKETKKWALTGIRNKDDAQRVLRHVPDEKRFYCHDGKILNNIYELKSALETMHLHTYNHHVTDEKNDFARIGSHAVHTHDEISLALEGYGIDLFQEEQLEAFHAGGFMRGDHRPSDPREYHRAAPLFGGAGGLPAGNGRRLPAQGQRRVHGFVRPRDHVGRHDFADFFGRNAL